MEFLLLVGDYTFYGGLNNRLKNFTPSPKHEEKSPRMMDLSSIMGVFIMKGMVEFNIRGRGLCTMGKLS